MKCAGDLLHYAISRDRWERRSQGESSKGQRYYDWTCFEVRVTGQTPASDFAHHLLIRRSTGKKQLASSRIDYELRLLPHPRPHRHPRLRDDLPERHALAG
ncbi:hypothetical protein GCM10022295_91890 [Streptomyces osmaniensis]|uniref:Transposase n=1 Tax=Streptomyces osmaniensis TaxID=593134 RepID=A0ABP6Z5S0_9ACTN